jgi:hypothetical protein
VGARRILESIINYALPDKLENIRNALPMHEKCRIKRKGLTMRVAVVTAEIIQSKYILSSPG